MENSNFKKELKEVMKTRLKGIVSESVEKYSAEFNKLVEQVTDSIATKVLDETKIEEIGKAVKQGATYIAVYALIRQVAQDTIKEAEPIINELAQSFIKLVSEAASEVIIELILEKLAKQETTSKCKRTQKTPFGF